MRDNKFPNGFTSWQETHFEIVSVIALFINEADEDAVPQVISFTYNMGGRGALYELAEQWTDEFESTTMHSHDDEDEQLDKLEKFISKKIKATNQ